MSSGHPGVFNLLLRSSYQLDSVSCVSAIGLHGDASVHDTQSCEVLWVTAQLRSL